MKQKQIFFALPLGLLLALMLGGCVIPSPAGATTPTTATPVAEEEATVAPMEEAPAVAETSVATATVSTRSLRVRAEPNETAEVVAGINEGEIYNVIGLSSDGLWVQLEIPAAVNGNGWVSANLVTLQGAITDAVITEVPTSTTVATDTAPVATDVVTTTTDTAPVTETVTTTDVMTTPESAPVTTDITTTATATATTDVTATGTTTATAPAPGYALVSTDGIRLRVRSEPNVDAEIVGYVYDGESYRVLDSSADGLWVLLAGAEQTPTDNPNGGWVSAEFLLIGQ